ncbi:uncharacterized protein LOC128276385, partial [Anopheles cruzii]|uniref:uncharacterized protein LOC128276385 n=1 Tax=Anopheles cruzii TaxID=68878 RepID=UPI0022EC6DFF
MALAGRPDFFRRHPFLQRLSVRGKNIPVEWVESITHHCPELNYLHLFLNDPNEGFLDSLVQLRKLKCLELRGQVDRKILRGAINSLESVELNVRYSRVLLENFFEVVPRLSRLKCCYNISYDEAQFICEKFACLRSLKLTIPSSAADDSVRIDKLMHLQELKLSSSCNIRSIHRNNVRCLTVLLSK